MKRRIAGRTGLVIVSVLGLLLAACSEEEGGRRTDPYEPSPAAIRQAQIIMPEDPHLADIYDRTCRSCHAYVDSGAPLTGHSREWRRRLQSGIDTLVERARTGYNAMPAMGLCFDCTDEDFRKLIEFMALPGPLSME